MGCDDGRSENFRYSVLSKESDFWLSSTDGDSDVLRRTLRLDGSDLYSKLPVISSSSSGALLQRLRPERCSGITGDESTIGPAADCVGW